MKLPRTAQKQISMTLIIAMICILSGVLTIPGCTSAAGKSKKKKIEKVEEEAETSSEKNDEAHPEEEAEKSPANKEDEKAGDNGHKDEKKKDSASEADEKSGKKKPESKTEKHASEEKNAKPPSADKIWAELTGGNKLFMKGKYNPGNLLGERPILAKGQKPNVVVLGCSDSRVPPELVFGENTGDLFVVRDAGNIVDEIALGSIEYAVEHLHASVIVVLGHESCGAVAATVAGEKMPTANLQAIVDKISPAFEGSDECEVGGKMNNSCVELNVIQTAKNITTKSSILRKAVNEERLTIFKAIYRLETGEVVRLK